MVPESADRLCWESLGGNRVHLPTHPPPPTQQRSLAFPTLEGALRIQWDPHQAKQSGTPAPLGSSPPGPRPLQGVACGPGPRPAQPPPALPLVPCLPLLSQGSRPSPPLLPAPPSPYLSSPTTLPSSLSPPLRT